MDTATKIWNFARIQDLLFLYQKTKMMQQIVWLP
jgi:hypothetical protein